jgi:hypothetical protein
MATRPEPTATRRTRGQGSTDLGRERGFALVCGSILIVLGLAGSLGTPFVGGADDTGLIVTGPGHDIIHLVLGALFLHVGLILDGRQRADALLILGTILLVSGVLSLLSPDLLGLYGAPTGVVDQVAHLALGVISIGIGVVARNAVVVQERRASSRTRSGRRP